MNRQGLGVVGLDCRYSFRLLSSADGRNKHCDREASTPDSLNLNRSCELSLLLLACFRGTVGPHAKMIM